jgi:glycosyltransferase involved in cell wall biosynthesis
MTHVSILEPRKSAAPMLTVYICTHNPKPGIFQEVLDALCNQEPAGVAVEILLVDNASSVDVRGVHDFGGLPGFRYLHEPKPGKVHAMLTAFRQARGELLVMVDDDNVLRPDYLRVAWELHQTHPELGAYGGSNHGRYLFPPPKWFLRHEQMIAVKVVESTRISKDPFDAQTGQVGAGLVFTRSVAEHFSRRVIADPRFLGLDRQEGKLMGGADVYLSQCAFEIGLARGVFPELALDHVIPAERVSISYLLALAEAAGYSNTIMKYVLHGEKGLSNLKHHSNILYRTKWLISIYSKGIKFAQIKRRIRHGQRLAFAAIHRGEYETAPSEMLSSQPGAESL